MPETSCKQKVHPTQSLFFSSSSLSRNFWKADSYFVMFGVGNIETNQEIQKKNNISAFFYYWEVLTIFVMWFA